MEAQEQQKEEVEVQQHTNGNPPARTWMEAPASVTIKTLVRRRDLMLTIRGESGQEVLGKAEAVLAWLDKNAPIESAQPPVPTAAAPAVPPPTPGTSIPSAVPQASESACAMIEIGTAYKSGAPQLRFYVSGFEKPLTFTKSPAQMLALLTPLGFTAEHFVVGQRYAVKALVKHQPYTNEAGKTYHNVLSVRPADA